MSIYFSETNDEQQRYLTECLPSETLHFSPKPLKTASQAHEIALVDGILRGAGLNVPEGEETFSRYSVQ